jgi:hypothetical protein
MSVGPSVLTVHCLSFREYFSPSNMKQILRGFVYEYETPKIVTIHSISSRFRLDFIFRLVFFSSCFPSCSYVSSYSITYINLWCCIFNDT